MRRVTDPKAVEAAMDEFDLLGREAFLAKHGFGTANRYYIRRAGHLYDSKAIYGAAHHIQFPEDGPKQSSSFSGGQHAVQEPLEALGYEFEVLEAGEDDPSALPEHHSITGADVALIAKSRSKQKYADLSDDEREAYIRISAALYALGQSAVASLENPADYEVRTTSGYSTKSGVRGGLPKDLWFSVSPKANFRDLAGMPQLFLIVSERGIEYGFGACVSPNDFSNGEAKRAVRSAAPKIFARLPAPGSTEASRLQEELSQGKQWHYRKKHRLSPNQSDFVSLDGWLQYLRSADGVKSAAGTISRYLLPEEVDETLLDKEVAEMARLFQDMIDREWRKNLAAERPVLPQPEELDLERSNEFGARLAEFVRLYGEKRLGAFGVDEELGGAMSRLQEWLETVPAVLDRQTVKVKISVGLGGWTKTPWIALLDRRETITTQHGTYIVFLIAEDLSTTYLTLNQGMTDLRKSLGQRGAAEEMVRVAEATRPLIRDLQSFGFQFDNQIDLRSDTGAAKNYEIGTIAHVTLPSSACPNDAEIRRYLLALLEAYDRVIDARQETPELEAVKMSEEAAIEPAEPYDINEAVKDLFLERDVVERHLETWLVKKNLILTGAPGVGKSFIARRLAYALIGAKDNHRVQAVQFHQSYSYEDFVQGYRPNGSQGFERRNGTFLEFRNRAVGDPDSLYVFIIDEINRGNLSKILGELMLLIEPDKRGPTWKTRLAYAAEGEEDFFVPENLFILGMMNTADRSLSLVDYALRRRFAFVAMEPLFGAPKFRAHLERHGIPDDVINKIVSGMGELNQAIESDRTNLGPGFRIGHSFFTPTGPVGNPGEWFRRIVETEIHPLLEEYWFDAPETADQWRDRLLR